MKGYKKDNYILTCRLLIGPEDRSDRSQSEQNFASMYISHLKIPVYRQILNYINASM